VNLEIMRDITNRNLAACEAGEIMSTKVADIYYYKGKSDALSHVIEMLDEMESGI
jgi:hypothetical protein